MKTQEQRIPSTVDLRNLYQYLSKAFGGNRKTRASRCARKRAEKAIECKRKKACERKRKNEREREKEAKKKSREREDKLRKPCAFGGRKYYRILGLFDHLFFFNFI